MEFLRWSNVDPAVVKEIKIDKELQLTCQQLELDPAIFYVQFNTELNQEVREQILREERSEKINRGYDVPYMKVN